MNVLRTRFMFLTILSVACAFQGGCSSGDSTRVSSTPMNKGVGASTRADSGSLSLSDEILETRASDWQTLPPPERILARDENTPRRAAAFIAQIRDLDQRPARRGLELHKSLYHAAFEFAFDRGAFSPSLAMLPPNHAPSGYTPREYYLAVLASMVEKSPSLGWISLDASGSAQANDRISPDAIRATRTPTHPETGQPAPLIGINVIAADLWKGIAQAEVFVRLPDGRTIGRTARVVYNGRTWTPTLQPVTWER